MMNMKKIKVLIDLNCNFIFANLYENDIINLIRGEVMNTTVNNALLEILTDEGKKDYINKFESIKNDFNNIYYLLEYLINDTDNNVIDAIKDYIVEYFELESKRNINKTLFQPLLEHHNELYDEIIKSFYSSYNLLDNSMELLKEIEENDEELFRSQIIEVINNLGIMKNITNVVSNFILNFCAIQFLCKKYNINVGIVKDLEFKMFILECVYIRNKITKLVFAYENKDYDDSNDKISLYDVNGLAKNSVKICINQKFPSAVEIMNKRVGNYDNMNLFVYCLSYYCALWDILINKSEYAESTDSNDFENTITIIFMDISSELNSKNKTNIDYYKRLTSLYEKAKEQYCLYRNNLISYDAITEIHKSFTKQVVNLERIEFAFYYVNVYREIHDTIFGSDNNLSTSSDEEFTCGDCGEIVDAEATECPYCGAEFVDETDKNKDEEFTCGDCGEIVDAEATECPYCGAEFI